MESADPEENVSQKKMQRLLPTSRNPAPKSEGYYSLLLFLLHFFLLPFLRHVVIHVRKHTALWGFFPQELQWLTTWWKLKWKIFPFSLYGVICVTQAWMISISLLLQVKSMGNFPRHSSTLPIRKAKPKVILLCGGSGRQGIRTPFYSSYAKFSLDIPTCPTTPFCKLTLKLFLNLCFLCKSYV